MAALSVVSPVSEDPRLRPPKTLSAAARKIFTAIVSSSSPTHFTIADMQLLTAYCEACAMADRAIAEINRMPIEKSNRALILFEKSTRTMTALSLRLRLAPQSRPPSTTKTTVMPPRDRFGNIIR
jgi:hypothetical protein